MAALSGTIDQWVKTLITDYLDPRSEDWWLCCSPAVPFGIVVVYLLLVKRIIPELMFGRQPFKIEPFIRVYNALQVVACFYVFWEGSREWIRQNYSFLCQPVDHAVNEGTDKIAHLVYTYYVIKITDLLDTIFFVLRKKFNQASFLHVYHHTVMIGAGYIACRFSLNGHFVMVGILNSFVHVVMYSYYLYTSLFPGEKAPLWVKKSLTSLQLVQFLILGLHVSLPLFQPSCGVQKLWSAILFPQSVHMSYMFLDFYQKEYLRPKKGKAA